MAQRPLRIITTTSHHPVETEIGITAVFARMETEIPFEEVLQWINLDCEYEQVGAFDNLEGLYAAIDKWIGIEPVTDTDRLLRQALGQPSLEDDFVEILTEPCIAIEHSPLELTNLFSQLKGATGVAIGAYVGLQVTSGPLLLVTVPLGMIIIGGASGVGAALEAGLRMSIVELISRWTPGGKPGSQGSVELPKRSGAPSAGRKLRSAGR
jgi:hypothetical protein